MIGVSASAGQRRRAAMAEELLLFHKAAIVPLILNQQQLISNQLEIMKSLGLMVDGQALVERTLARAMPDDDDEPWKRSLEPDDDVDD